MARAEVGPRRDPPAGPDGMPGPVLARVREYRARLDKDPRDVEALLGMAGLNLQRRNLSEAIDYYKRTLDVDPGNPEALSHMGLILVEGGHVEPALTALDRALARNPTHPLALWGKGLALYEGKHDYAGAIEAWERLLATNPDLAAADADHVASLLVDARKKLPKGEASEPRPARPAPDAAPR
jgi:cytochrome c-type biogenesis protein CcmH/NrfG